MAQSESRPEGNHPAPPPPGARNIAKAARAKPTDEDAALATHLGISLDLLLDLRRKRHLTNDDLLNMSRDRIDRTARKMRVPKPDHPIEWEQWRLKAWRDEDGNIPDNPLITAKTQFDALSATDTTGGLNTASWTALGPGNIGGRVRSIAIHPTTTTTMFCGSVSGGIWKSTNAGASWSVVQDFMGSLSISSIVFTPGNPLVMYASTGESFTGDGLRGAGIFKSPDGGVTWSQLPATNNANFYYVNRLSFSPNGATLLAATNTGIWRSINAGSTFSLAFGSSGNVGSKDVQFHPLNSNIAIADFVDYDFGISSWFHAVAFSTNGGATFSEAANTRTNNYYGRIEVAWAKGWTGAGNGCAYAMRNSGNGELLRSIDGGATWTFVAANSNLNGSGDYYNALWIDPSNADASTANDVILSGGMDVWRSTDGGVTFTKVTQWYSWPSSPHADHHAIIEDPGFNGTTNRRVYLGNDGGVWKTDNVSTATVLSGWTNLNNQLQVTQAYGASRCAINGTIEMGTQDNGTLKYTPAGGVNGWTTTFGGDGGFCASDPTNSNINYGEYVFADLFRSTDGGASGDYINGMYWNGSNYVWKSPPYQITDSMTSTTEFITPFIMDPNSPTRILVGCRNLWRTSTATATNTSTTGPSWAVIKPPNPAGSYISAIAIAPTDSNVVWVGHENGNVYSTSNGLAVTPTWTLRSNTVPNLPARMVTRITIDPANASRVFVTFGGFTNTNLWQTTNAGANWTAASGMPSVPLRDVEISYANPNWLYVGSELGLLISQNNGASWTTTTDGPANVSIDEMFWSSGYLHLATHGRGMYRATPYPAASLAVGAGCQSGLTPPLPSAPTFTATNPILGGSGTLSYTSAPYPAPGLVFLSFVPGAPTPVGGSCFAYVDVPTATQLSTITTLANGTGSLNSPIPDVPAWAGLQLSMQVIFVPASGGYALTNGRTVTLGY